MKFSAFVTINQHARVTAATRPFANVSTRERDAALTGFAAVFLRTVEQGALFDHPQVVMREIERRLNTQVIKLEEGDNMALIFWRKKERVDPELMSAVRKCCSGQFCLTLPRKSPFRQADGCCVCSGWSKRSHLLFQSWEYPAKQRRQDTSRSCWCPSSD